jgi:hypothetical protein
MTVALWRTVACDAMMRLIERERTTEAAMKTQAATLLAAVSASVKS